METIKLCCLIVDLFVDFVFPTIKRCNPTQSKLYGRVKRINEKVNGPLRKICDHCGIKSRVAWELLVATIFLR